MKILKFKHDTEDPTKDAHQHCLDLEAATGLSLMNHDPLHPNEVHGYINTSSDGTVEVYLYEQEDVDAIVATPAHLKANVVVKKHDDTFKDTLKDKFHQHMNDKGFVVQEDSEKRKDANHAA